MKMRLSRTTFPKIKPEKAVLDYRISKNMTKTDKLHPEFDIIRQNDPKVNLAILQINLRNSEKLLRKKRKDLLEARKDLNKQWTELAEKERSLRENFQHFNTFVRENLEKRERAEKKILEDKALKEKRQKDINELVKLYIDFKKSKFDMDAKIREYRLYEDYLESVVDHSDEFTSIGDMINRYLALVNARNHLAKLQEENLRALETARSDMMKLVEEKNFIIMGLNNQIANLQARFENANIKSLECEQLVIQIKNNAIRQINEIDEVKASIWNVYMHMAQSKEHPVKIKKENVEEQMMYIKRTLTELSKVNQILKRRSKILSKAKNKQ